jgi:hypothetical protein
MLTAVVNDDCRKNPATTNDPANDICRIAQRRANESCRTNAANNRDAANDGRRSVSMMNHRPLPQECRNHQRSQQRPFPQGRRQAKELWRTNTANHIDAANDKPTRVAARPPQCSTNRP